MKFYEAPFYTEEQLNELSEEQIHFPFSDKDAKYLGLYHQYELTSEYFEKRGVNLEQRLEGNNPTKVANFLSEVRRKVYDRVYYRSRSTRRQMNYLIAKKGLTGFSPYEYRQSFLDVMFLEGCYLLDNGDISNVAGIDLDTMQNMSDDVVRNQERDFSKNVIRLMAQLGLSYFGKYNFIPLGEDW